MGFLWSGYGKTSFVAKHDDSKGFLHPLGRINPDMRVFGVCVKGVRFFILPFFSENHMIDICGPAKAKITFETWFL